MALGLVLIAVASRLLPHWHNFTAVGATGLFAAYYYRKLWISVLITILGMWISDLFLNNIVYSAFNDGLTFFNNYMIWSYLGFALLTISGSFFLRKVKPGFVVASLVGSITFFLVSNLGAFVVDPLYPKTGAGLLACYVAGIPFFVNTLLATIMYSYLLYSIHRWSVSQGIVPQHSV